jgi:hypothetical protein
MNRPFYPSNVLRVSRSSHLWWDCEAIPPSISSLHFPSPTPPHPTPPHPSASVHPLRAWLGIPPSAPPDQRCPQPNSPRCAAASTPRHAPSPAPSHPTHAVRAALHSPMGRKRVPMASMRSLPMEPGPDRIRSPGTGDGVRPDRGASAVDLTSPDFVWRKGPFSHGRSRLLAHSLSGHLPHSVRRPAVGRRRLFLRPACLPACPHFPALIERAASPIEEMRSGSVGKIPSLPVRMGRRNRPQRLRRSPREAPIADWRSPRERAGAAKHSRPASERRCATAWRPGIRANLRAARGALQCAPFLGWLANRALPMAVPPEKSARFVRSLRSAQECPRSSREALPGSGCRPPGGASP